MPPIEGHESIVGAEEKLALVVLLSLYWFNALVQIFKVRSGIKKPETLLRRHVSYVLLELVTSYFHSVRAHHRTTRSVAKGEYTPLPVGCQPALRRPQGAETALKHSLFHSLRTALVWCT